MRDKVKYYLGLPYSIYVVPDVTTNGEPCYMAYHPELEGCMSHGYTLDETLHNLAEATELYISALLDKGLDVPLPQGVGMTWDISIVPSEVKTEDISKLPSITSPIFVPIS